MIRFRCSRCGKKLKADEDIVGRKVKCSRCDKVETVPESDNLTRPVVSEEYAQLAEAEAASKSKKIDPTTKVDEAATESSTDFSELIPDSHLAVAAPRKNPVRSGSTDEEPSPELFGHSASPSAGRPMDGPQFTPRKLKRKVKVNPWVKRGIAALCGIVVLALIGSYLIRQAYSEPKFRAEFEKMEEVQFYRRGLVQLEKSRRRMAVVSESIFVQGLGTEEMKREVEKLNESADDYVKNTRALLTQSAKMMLADEAVEAKGLLVNTGHEMKTLATSIEEAMAEFPKQR